MTDRNYDSIVVLSNRINLDGTLQEDVRARMDKAIQIYNLGDVETLTASGNHDPKDKDAICNHAEAMRRYAITQGVLPEKILKEDTSLETVGQAYFTKVNLALPRNWEKLVVVSSDYHLPRVIRIFDLIFGPQFLMLYANSQTALSQDPEAISKERRSLETFLGHFGSVTPGDHDQVKRILLKKHTFYKGREDLFQ